MSESPPLWYDWNMAKKPLPDKLRICLVAHRFPLLGRAAAHGFLWPIARGLAQNHEVTILSHKNPQGKYEIKQDDVTAFYLGHRYQGKDFPLAVDKKFNELHSQKPFHIVHSIDNSGFAIGLKKKQHKVAMTYNVEATGMSQIFSIMGMAKESLKGILHTGLAVAYVFLRTYYGGDRKLLKTADGIFVTSPQQKLALERHYLYPELKTYSIPYGIEIGDLSPRERSEEFRKKLNIPKHVQIVVTLTDMNEVAEVKNLLRAFEKVAIKKPSTRLIILGDGPFFKVIEKAMLNLVLGSKVTFLKSVSHAELLDCIALADAFVNLSSRTSGLDPGMIEAMAQQKVIIGSEMSSISTIVEDGINGFLIRPADVNSLSALLMQIFDGHVPVNQIGQQARQKVMNLFDTQKMVEQTVIAYKKALSHTGYYKIYR